MTYHNYTPEQIAAIHDRNQNFHGKIANLPKIRIYQQIKTKLDELLEQCPDVCKVDGYPPNVREQCAIIWVDLKALSMMDDETSTLLSEAMRIADDICIRGGKSGWIKKAVNTHRASRDGN